MGTKGPRVRQKSRSERARLVTGASKRLAQVAQHACPGENQWRRELRFTPARARVHARKRSLC
jgi:hypothetical protein